MGVPEIGLPRDRETCLEETEHIVAPVAVAVWARYEPTCVHHANHRPQSCAMKASCCGIFIGFQVAVLSALTRKGWRYVRRPPFVCQQLEPHIRIAGKARL